MFHEVSFRDSFSGKVEQVPKEAVGRATDQFFERYLKPAGLDGAGSPTCARPSAARTCGARRR